VPQITIDVPTAQVARVVDAMCRAGGYPGDPDDQQARVAFAKQMVARYVRETVQKVEAADAFAAALDAVAPSDPLNVT
jgi:hypothetical protein